MQSYEVRCSECGKPFKRTIVPRSGVSVYCAACIVRMVGKIDADIKALELSLASLNAKRAKLVMDSKLISD